MCDGFQELGRALGGLVLGVEEGHHGAITGG
jgi:hypothetical protein